MLLSSIQATSQVPNTTTFSFSDVRSNIPGNPNSLSGCFSASNDTYFDPAYKGNKDRLSNFRNYKYRHYIGESYQGGNIVYISTDGLSGLIVSNVFMTDGGNTDIRWYNGANRAAISTSGNYGEGSNNTNNILSVIGSSGRAARVCKDYRGGGYSDWFLPSLNELAYVSDAYINGHIDQPFIYTNEVWSSTAHDGDNVYAWYKNIGYNTNNWHDDYYMKKVVACRYFVDNIPYWYNVETSGTAQKNDCGTGYYGTTETFTVSPGSFMSYVSQTDANNQALTYVNANKQTYANNVGSCIPNASYSSAAISESIQKNNCGTGYVGSYYTWTMPAGSYTSTISQADADNQARAYYDANKQSVANTNGSCSLITNTHWTFTSDANPAASYMTISVDGVNQVNVSSTASGDIAIPNGSAVVVTVHGNMENTVYSHIEATGTGLSYTHDNSGFKNVTDTYSFSYSTSYGNITINTQTGSAL